MVKALDDFEMLQSRSVERPCDLPTSLIVHISSITICQHKNSNLFFFNSEQQKSESVSYDQLLDSGSQSTKTKLLGNRMKFSYLDKRYPVIMSTNQKWRY